MKLVILFLITLLSRDALSEVTEKADSQNPLDERKLYENLTASYLLGDTVDSTDTSHLSLLIS